MGIGLTGLLGSGAQVLAADYDGSPQVTEFITEMTRDYGFASEQLVSLFAEHHPSLNFQLHALSSEQIIEGLGRNQLDLGLSYLDRLDRQHFACLELGEALDCIDMERGAKVSGSRFFFLKGVGALGDAGKALIARGDINPWEVRRTINGIRADAGAVRRAYNEVRGAAGNPLERGC